MLDQNVCFNRSQNYLIKSLILSYHLKLFIIITFISILHKINYFSSCLFAQFLIITIIISIFHKYHFFLLMISFREFHFVVILFRRYFLVLFLLNFFSPHLISITVRESFFVVLIFTITELQKHLGLLGIMVLSKWHSDFSDLRSCLT